MKNLNKDIAVLGLGTFGYELAKDLFQAKLHVLAVDINPQLINKIKNDVTVAVQADVTDMEVLKKLDLNQFDKVILGMSNSLENLILTITYLKKINTKYIIAKANTEIQKEILLKIGANEVIQPEISIAKMLVKKIAYPFMIETLAVDSENVVVEVKVPNKFTNRSIRELNFRQKYGILILMKKSDSKYQIVTNPDERLSENDIIFVAGKETQIQKVFES